mgnify:FL=1|jgi:hypothetical protein
MMLESKLAMGFWGLVGVVAAIFFLSVYRGSI